MEQGNTLYNIKTLRLFEADGNPMGEAQVAFLLPTNNKAVTPQTLFEQPVQTVASSTKDAVQTTVLTFQNGAKTIIQGTEKVLEKTKYFWTHRHEFFQKGAQVFLGLGDPMRDNLRERAQGALQLGLGVAGVVGTTVAAATGEVETVGLGTPVIAPMAAAAISISADSAKTGFLRLWTGKPRETQFVQTLVKLGTEVCPTCSVSTIVESGELATAIMHSPVEAALHIVSVGLPGEYHPDHIEKH